MKSFFAFTFLAFVSHASSIEEPLAAQLGTKFADAADQPQVLGVPSSEKIGNIASKMASKKQQLHSTKLNDILPESLTVETYQDLLIKPRNRRTKTSKLFGFDGKRRKLEENVKDIDIN